MAVTISLIPFVKLPEVFSSLMTSLALFGKGLALGLVSTFFPFVSYTLGLRQMEAGKASVLAFSEPMVAAMAGIVVFGEMLRVENVLGLCAVIQAVTVDHKIQAARRTGIIHKVAAPHIILAVFVAAQIIVVVSCLHNGVVDLRPLYGQPSDLLLHILRLSRR